MYGTRWGWRGIQRSQESYLHDQLKSFPLFNLLHQVPGGKGKAHMEERQRQGNGGALQRPQGGHGEWRTPGPACLPGESKGLVDAPLQPLPTLCLPHEPQLQAVHSAATLHHLVSGVQSHIIELVLLEEVAGLGSVAALEQVLCGRKLSAGLPKVLHGSAASQLSHLASPW